MREALRQARRARAEARSIGEREHLLSLLLADSERQLVALAGTFSAISTRAAILIASASIVTGIQVLPVDDAAWYLLALIAAAFSALTGVVVIVPRIGKQVAIRRLEAEGWNDGDAEASRRVLYSRLAVIESDNVAVWWRGIVVTAGFISLFAAVLFACLQLAGVDPPFVWKLADTVENGEADG